MTNIVNGIQYIGQDAAAEALSIYHHASAIDGNLTIENAVLAGPVSFADTLVVTGTLVVV